MSVSLPPAPGAGPYVLSLNTPAFYILIGVLAVFGLLLSILWGRHRGRKRAFEGFTEAAWVDLVFVGAALLLAVSLTSAYPSGNSTSQALFQTVLGGYWLSFAIPIVTVGSSIHSRTRGGIPWLLPSVIAALAMFLAIFLYTFYAIYA